MAKDLVLLLSTFLMMKCRPAAKKDEDGGKKTFTFPVPKEQLNSKVIPGGRNSYMGALKRGNRVEAEDTKSEPSILLGDECVNDNNLSNALLGRVKEFASLANLKLALGNEGFGDITIKYMGELWVLLEFKSEESKNKFKDNVSVASWFSQIIKALTNFEVEGRIAWVEVEGVPFKLWSGNTFSRIANTNCEREGDGQKFDGMDENSDAEEVPDTMFEDEELVRNYVVGDPLVKKGDNSEDPFNIYSFLNRNNPLEKNVKVSDDSLKYPPGYTPFDGTNEKTDSDVVDRVQKCEDLKTCNKEEKMMIIVVYAPQESKEKQNLWDYLQQEIAPKCDKIDSMEMAQKAKVKWAVEGDENAGFFHGTINKRRNILNIRGVMVDGTWIDRSENVKKSFLNTLVIVSVILENLLLRFNWSSPIRLLRINVMIWREMSLMMRSRRWCGIMGRIKLWDRTILPLDFVGTFGI
nr:nucleotide-binding alpha-beta plait domain-containing protein [Tanacetum cinerariifolium]